MTEAAASSCIKWMAILVPVIAICLEFICLEFLRHANLYQAFQ